MATRASRRGILYWNAAEMKFASTYRCRVRGDAQRWLSTEATGTFPCDRSIDAAPLPLLDVAVA
jgi:hypothetical protein